MKNFYFLLSIGLFCTITYGGLEPSAYIVETYWRHKNPTSKATDAVLLDHNRVMLSFFGEKSIEHEIKEHYTMWLSGFYDYDELSQEEKKSFYGYFLKSMQENNVEDDSYTALDNCTMCTKKNLRYECITLIDKPWAEELRKQLNIH